MSKVPVVEIRELSDEGDVTPIGRFVLSLDGIAHFIELRPSAQGLVEMLLQEGVPGVDGRLLFPQDGLAFMQRIVYVVHGTYLWATEVFETDEPEALSGMPRDNNSSDQ
jgi:hypothetical protein